jgi:catechol 2,3-dioxygenase-like lactoylglutathione lyase family enzyme
VFVADVGRAVEFYTETLGLKLLYRAGDHFAMVDAGDLKLGLHPPARNAGAPGTRGSIQVGLTVACPIEQAVDTLKQRGVRFSSAQGSEIVDDGQVRLAFFTDPDGNDLYLCEVKTS